METVVSVTIMPLMHTLILILLERYVFAYALLIVEYLC
jgi:hypothetical protein